MKPTIHQGDVLDWAAAYSGEPFHALLCDPPYHLTEAAGFSTGVHYGAPRSEADKARRRRGTKGFMGKSWDGGDLAFRPETWRAFWPLLHPGAFAMAFAGSRGWHRMAVAIEDAGYVIHPTMFLWNYASGFPKATRIDTQIDAAAGVPVARGTAHPAFAPRHVGYRAEEFATNGHEDGAKHEPATDLARAWAGHRYGLQAIKPAVEPIIVFQKPYAGRAVESITRTGAGSLNIDAGRIGTNGGGWNGLGEDGKRLIYGDTGWNPDGIQRNDGGRWPSNLVLSHLPACEPRGPRRVRGSNHQGGGSGGIWSQVSNTPVSPGHADADGYETITDYACAPGCAVDALGRQSGETYSSGTQVAGNAHPSGIYSPREKQAIGQIGKGDTGTAARFFFQADYAAERLEAADAVIYQAKASTFEREAGLWGNQDHDQATPADTDTQPATDTTEYGTQQTNGSSLSMCACGRPRTGQSPKGTASTTRTTTSKTTASKTLNLSTQLPISDFIQDVNSETVNGSSPAGCAECSRPLPLNTGISPAKDGPHTESAEHATSEKWSSINVIVGRDNARRNQHPCCKPIALARHLAALLLPPSLYAPRRLFVPFAGVASECIGAMQAGWEHVEGVELEADHVEIARARIDYWAARGWQRGLFDED